METRARIFIKVKEILDWNELRTLGDLDKYCLFDADEVFDEEISTTITMGIGSEEWGCEIEPLCELVKMIAMKLPEQVLIIADCCAADNAKQGIAVWYAGADVHVERTKELAELLSLSRIPNSYKFEGINIQSETDVYAVAAWFKTLDITLDVDEMNYLADFDIYLTDDIDCRDENDTTLQEDEDCDVEDEDDSDEEDDFRDEYNGCWDEDDDYCGEDYEDDNEDEDEDDFDESDE